MSRAAPLRAFLASKARDALPPDTSIRGHGDIVPRLARFQAQLHDLVATRRVSLDEINDFDYMPDWLTLAARWQAATP